MSGLISDGFVGAQQLVTLVRLDRIGMAAAVAIMNALP
jgi:hypothetical protein